MKSKVLTPKQEFFIIRAENPVFYAEIFRTIRSGIWFPETGKHSFNSESVETQREVPFLDRSSDLAGGG